METAMKKTFALLLLPLMSLAHAANPNDAQIAAIVVAANTVDIDAGKLPNRNPRTRRCAPSPT
jgi:putative membrane protein